VLEAPGRLEQRLERIYDRIGQIEDLLEEE